MTVVIEPMTVADAAACGRIEARLFVGDGPWTEAMFRSERVAPHCRYFAARAQDGAVVGYAGVSLLGGPEPAAEIQTIAIDTPWQGKGLGRVLLDTLLAIADEHGGPVHLEVRTDNVTALELYRRSGFHIVGTRKRYYHSGADAYTMTRPARVSVGKGEA